MLFFGSNATVGRSRTFKASENEEWNCTEIEISLFCYSNENLGSRGPHTEIKPPNICLSTVE
jgi:hypothetical protein